MVLQVIVFFNIYMWLLDGVHLVLVEWLRWDAVLDFDRCATFGSL